MKPSCNILAVGTVKIIFGPGKIILYLLNINENLLVIINEPLKISKETVNINDEPMNISEVFITVVDLSQYFSVIIGRFITYT